MALTSTTSRSVHPDEFSHVSAAQYYFDHWLPPAVDAPETADSYSAYGASYLNELDVVYLIAAKATHFWSGFGLDATTTLRLFNICLFGVLLAIAWIRPSVWPAAIVLLLTPQIWYIFSYFNADAFAFFLSLLATMLFAANDSPVSRFVEGERVSRVALGIFVVSLGLLLISKRNYIPVVFATALLLAVRHLGVTVWISLLCAVGVALLMFRLVAGDALVYMFPNFAAWFVPAGLILLVVFAVLILLRVVHRPELRPRLYRLACLFVLAFLVALPRVVVDVLENGGPATEVAAHVDGGGEVCGSGIQAVDVGGQSRCQLSDPLSCVERHHVRTDRRRATRMVGDQLVQHVGNVRIHEHCCIATVVLSAVVWNVGAEFRFVRWAFTHPEARVNLVVAVVGVALVAVSLGTSQLGKRSTGARSLPAAQLSRSLPRTCSANRGWRRVGWSRSAHRCAFLPPSFPSWASHCPRSLGS